MALGCRPDWLTFPEVKSHDVAGMQHKPPLLFDHAKQTVMVKEEQRLDCLLGMIKEERRLVLHASYILRHDLCGSQVRQL